MFIKWERTPAESLELLHEQKKWEFQHPAKRKVGIPAIGSHGAGVAAATFMIIILIPLSVRNWRILFWGGFVQPAVFS